MKRSSAALRPRHPTSWSVRALMVATGLAVGATVALPMLWWSRRPPASDGIATNALSAEQMRAWYAAPRFFVRDGEKMVTHHPHMVRQVFSVEKPAEEYRIFLLGGSAALGVPYVHPQPEIDGVDMRSLDLTNTGGIATWLEHYFSLLYADKRVHVVNAAMGSQNVAAAAHVFAEIAEIGDPDLVVLMSGNNESYNQNYPTVEEFEEALETLTENYTRQVEKIASSAESYRIDTYLLTVPTNIADWVPQGGDHALPPGEAERTIELAAADPDAPAIDDALRRLADEKHALHHYILALRQRAREDHDEAYAHFVRAKDRDFALIRAHSRWNDAILGADGASVHAIDVAERLRAYAHDGVPGYDLFHDNCHLTIEANVAVAREVASFHRDRLGLGKADLPMLDVRAHMKRNLEALYEIKAAKWQRLDDLGLFDYLGEHNRRRIQEQFESERLELMALTEAIGRYERDLFEGTEARPTR